MKHAHAVQRITVYRELITLSHRRTLSHSHRSTLTPRQRITVYREMKRLEAMPAGTASAAEEARLVTISKGFEYDGAVSVEGWGGCLGWETATSGSGICEGFVNLWVLTH
jgi:hypothetical protein